MRCHQSTARLGISVGISGIVAGLASTLAYMNPASAAVYAQVCVAILYKQKLTIIAGGFMLQFHILRQQIIMFQQSLSDAICFFNAQSNHMLCIITHMLCVPLPRVLSHLTLGVCMYECNSSFLSSSRLFPSFFHPPPPSPPQLMMLGGSGAGIGYYLSTKIGPTELPQAVAAFHSLVRFAMAEIQLFCFKNQNAAKVFQNK